MRSKKRSAWFEGLLCAEDMGVQESYEISIGGGFYKTNISRDEFVRGVVDYITHHEKLQVLEKAATVAVKERRSEIDALTTILDDAMSCEAESYATEILEAGFSRRNTI